MLQRTAGALSVLILMAGCGEDRSTARQAVLSSCVNLVDRAEDAMSIGAWSPPEDVRIAGFRVAGLSKRCVRVPAGRRVELPGTPVVAGMELWLEVALDPKTPPEAALELRVSAHGAGDGGGQVGTEPASRQRSLLQRRLAGRGNTPRWQHVSVDLPPELDESLVLGLEVSPASAGGAVLVGDVVLVPGVEAYTGERPANVLLITLDTLRADHLPIYGYGEDTAPFLTKLAEGMTVYERAYSPSTWTLPAHASLFTGLLPGQHEAISKAGEIRGGALPREVTTLAEVLAERGYLSLGVVAGPMLKRHFDLDQGFACYSDDFRRADAVTDLALEWIDRAEGRPYLLFLNYFDAHLPLDPPGYEADDEELYERVGIDIRKFQFEFMPGLGLESLPEDVNAAMLARYDAEIRFLDSQLERLFGELERRGLLDETLVCIVADHGESYGENGFWGHGGAFFEPQARVPLLYRDRREPLRESRVQAPTSTREVAGWILDDLGIPAPDPALERRALPVYGERFTPWGSMRMLRDDRYLYLLSFLNATTDRRRVTEKLYDLELDPRALVDIAPEGGEPLDRVRQQLSVLMRQDETAKGSRRSLPASAEAGLSEELRELKAELEALGYAGDR